MLPTTINNQTALATQGLGADAYTRFLAYCGDCKPSTLKAYRRHLQHFFGWIRANGITQPTRAEVIAYRNALMEEGKQPNTVQAYIAAIRAFFGWAQSEGLYPHIAKKIKTGVTREHKKDPLSIPQIKIILQSMPTTTIKDARNLAIVYLMSACALRTIEVARLTVEDFVNVAGRPAIMVHGKGKDEKTPVNLPAGAEQAIRSYWARAGISSGYAFQSTSNHNAGGGMTTRAISGMVKETLKAAGYNSDRLTAHSPRHSAINAQIEAGAPLVEVQHFARHADPSTTMVYVHAFEGRKNRCADSNDALLFDAIRGAR